VVGSDEPVLKQRSEFFQSLMMLNDLFFLSVAWWLAYLIRFSTDFFPEPEAHLFLHYLVAWLVILIVWTVVFHWLDFYRPRRMSSQKREIVEVLKGTSLALLIFLGILFLLRVVILSRIVVIFFAAFSFIFHNISHVLFREGLRFLRRRGYNLRHVLIIGTPRQVDQLAQKLQEYRQFGLRIAAVYLTQQAPVAITPVEGRCLEDTDELKGLVKSGALDQIFVTLPLEQAGKLAEIQQWLDDEPVTLHFIPDLGDLAKLRGRMEEFDGLPIISLQSSPLHGWNSCLKRIMDLSIGGLAFVAFAPLMVLIASVIKLTSSGSILYRQERMGLDGRKFQILKFRTMVKNAEQKTGPVWATADDPRVTPFGRILRATSLDELPQLINVLRGEMSLVGPRPERPALIQYFRKSIPGYMLRHKVKAGITGWAQVNGWRGNTSLESRIQHDLDYIGNWSIWRDLKILALTLFGGFRNKGARGLRS
jgi:Undecaprenyl-phosphate glucose phosphotransferase